MLLVNRQALVSAWDFLPSLPAHGAIPSFSRRPCLLASPVLNIVYNYFLMPQGLGPGPYDFRVTDMYGHVLEEKGMPFLLAASIPGRGQFDSCGTMGLAGHPNLPSTWDEPASRGVELGASQAIVPQSI